MGVASKCLWYFMREGDGCGRFLWLTVNNTFVRGINCNLIRLRSNEPFNLNIELCEIIYIMICFLDF